MRTARTAAVSWAPAACRDPRCQLCVLHVAARPPPPPTVPAAVPSSAGHVARGPGLGGAQRQLAAAGGDGGAFGRARAGFSERVSPLTLNSIVRSLRPEWAAGSFLPKLVFKCLGICKEEFSLWETCFLSEQPTSQGRQVCERLRSVAWVPSTCLQAVSGDGWATAHLPEGHFALCFSLASNRSSRRRPHPVPARHGRRGRRAGDAGGCGRAPGPEIHLGEW